MLLKTDRLLLRTIALEDWESIRGIWEDFGKSEFARYDVPHDTDPEDVRKRIARWAEASTGMEHMFFAVCIGDQVIGYIDCHALVEGYEIGYCFHSAYHGMGYAKESVSALLDHLQSFGVTRFTAGTALGNTPSVALLKSLGFRQTGEEKVSFYNDAAGNPIVFDGGIFECRR